jgi:hypothetical protein
MGTEDKNKLDDFLDLLKKKFSNADVPSPSDIAPFYSVGKQLGFPKELLDLFMESIVVSDNGLQALTYKYEGSDEKQIDAIIENERLIHEKEVQLLKEKVISNNQLFLDELILYSEIPYKSKYLMAFWNKYYERFSQNNPALDRVLMNFFELKKEDKIPLFRVVELFKSDKKSLEKIIAASNGVGKNKVLELKKLLGTIIQEANALDEFVNKFDIEKKLIDFLFKIDAITEENVKYLINYKSKPIAQSAPYPIFWLFDLYLKSISKSNDYYYLVYKLILSKQDYSDEKVSQLCNVVKNRIQQLRQDFLSKLDTYLAEFKVLFSTTVTIDFFISDMKSYSEFEKCIKDHLDGQDTHFRLSFCNVLLSNFNDDFRVTDSYNEMFKTKNLFGKKCTAIHLLPIEDYPIYQRIIEELTYLSHSNQIRNLFDYKLTGLLHLKGTYLKDIVQFELSNWTFKTDKLFLHTPIEIDFEKYSITRVDVQNTGLKELTEISDLINTKNNFNTFYNQNLKDAFVENNTYGYLSRYNDATKRHLDELGFFSVANKWVRKSYIRQYVSEELFIYKKCNFKDLIVELIRNNPDHYAGKNLSFWVQELNRILEHNYKGVNNLTAIHKDSRIRSENGRLFLAES